MNMMLVMMMLVMTIKDDMFKMIRLIMMIIPSLVLSQPVGYCAKYVPNDIDNNNNNYSHNNNNTIC
jgi:hypothetical protein